MFSHQKQVISAMVVMSVMAPGLCLAENADSYIGSIFPTAAYYCPDKTAQANGQVLPIVQYQALYSVIGNSFGGDGRSTFALPDLRGRTLVASGQGPGLTYKYLGSRGGRESVTLTTSEMPTHTHSGSTGATVSVSLSASTSQGEKTIPSDGDYLASKKQGLFKYQPYLNGAPVPPNTVALGGVAIPSGVPVGQVSVSPAGGFDGEVYPIDLRAPLLTINYCIVIQGIYPPRPR
ncbi:phage tail protein [Aestuariispira ectoiniformans]|uniref:phage tail protein n=1 Tax=Aestuariispira ectoiniformans TaxID=2775080 RepID=UPI00223BC834|nr:tail fiber protein [Aestuariispira ectoiniformans]